MQPLSSTPHLNAEPTKTSLQLLLFVDKRPGVTEQIRQVQSYLRELSQNYAFELQVIDVSEQPYLAEHFKLVVTPSLVKIKPEPRHILTGTDLVKQLEKWWQRWQRQVEDTSSSPPTTNKPTQGTAKTAVAQSAEVMQLTDQIFRLNQEKESLQEQLRFKERIITMLAHDLRNPLTATSIALETLEGQWDPQQPPEMILPPEMLQRLTQQARQQTQIIERMIANCLEAARHTTVAMQIHPQPVNLKSLCQQVIHDLADQFASKAQQLKLDLPNDLPQVYADANQIQQVLINLLDNASKYTPEDGVIQLAVLHRTTQQVQVSVCDNGLGIPIENQEHIFDPEFRLQRDYSQTGYGLGLASCRQIVMAHYGQIWVDSQMGRGSNFHFTLPVYRA